jgi:heme oxygenase
VHAREVALNIAVPTVHPFTALSRLRAATGELHQAIEARLDIVERLADPSTRREMIARFGALYGPAAAAFEPWLADVPGLGPYRSGPVVAEQAGLPFPMLGNRAEALGMRYVLEGSMLGGRLIQRRLAERGINDPRLAFLDPYGAETGVRWRAFLSVLARELTDERLIADACRGAILAFRHAERVLGGSRP